jgi:hypothetical protein
MEGLGRIPRHCRSCGKRFYVDGARFGAGRAAEGQGGEAQGAEEDHEPDAKKKADA